MHSLAKPALVKVDGTTMQEYTTLTEWLAAESGWYYAPDDKNGIAYVKTGLMDVSSTFELRLEDLISSIPNLTDDDSIEVHPNPTNGAIVVTSKKSSPIATIKIYDVLGSLVASYIYDTPITSTNINLPKDSSIFFVNVETRDGAIVVRKVILN